MDWGLITTIVSGVTALGAFGLSLYNAKANRNKIEIDNLSRIIDMQGTQIQQLSSKVEKLEKRDRVKTEAIQTAYRCKLYENKSDCPVLAHINEKYKTNN